MIQVRAFTLHSVQPVACWQLPDSLAFQPAACWQLPDFLAFRCPRAMLRALTNSALLLQCQRLPPSLQLSQMGDSKPQGALGGPGQGLKYPLLLFGIGGAAYYEYTMSMAWFSHHPAAMLVAFVALSGNAALIKKKGGYDNTKAHGSIMSLAMAIGLLGWYVIYSNKEANGKPHLQSWHSWVGIAALAGWVALAIAGAVALHPDFGIMKTNKNIRLIHKWGGRVANALGWIACVQVSFIDE